MSHLAAEHPNLFSQFGIFGIIKEVNVDDEGLLEFYTNYFRFPLYVDSSRQFYAALGNRKLGWRSLTTWNPIRIWRSFQKIKQRLQQKDITGNMEGDAWIQGGIIMFDKDGEPRAVYPEKTTFELPGENILAALKFLSNEATQNKESV